jgi:hypothetical protein
MVLMTVVAPMRKNDIGAEFARDLFEALLDAVSKPREKSVVKIVNLNGAGLRARHDHPMVLMSLGPTFRRAGKGHPFNLEVWLSFEQMGDGAAAADFNVIAMSAKDQEATRASELKGNHDRFLS